MSKKTRECLLCFRIKNVIKKGSKKEKKKEKRIKIVSQKKKKKRHHRENTSSPDEMGDRGPTDVSVDLPGPRQSQCGANDVKGFHPSCCVITQTNRPHSIAAAASLLARPVDFGVHHSHMPGQCIIARESLFFGAQMTADLLLAGIVDRVFVPCQIVGSRED